MTKTEQQIIDLVNSGKRLVQGRYSRNFWIIEPGSNTSPWKLPQIIKTCRRVTVSKLTQERVIVVGLYPGESTTQYMTAELKAKFEADE